MDNSELISQSVAPDGHCYFSAIGLALTKYNIKKYQTKLTHDIDSTGTNTRPTDNNIIMLRDIVAKYFYKNYNENI